MQGTVSELFCARSQRNSRRNPPAVTTKHLARLGLPFQSHGWVEGAEPGGLFTAIKNIQGPKGFTQKDYIGVRFGRLIVTTELDRYYFPGGKNERRVQCRCDCGKTHDTLLMHLKSGKTLSCGCLSHERTTTHGYSKGRCSTYVAWANMVKRGMGRIDRANYFDRGIGICERWLKFECFLADMGIKPDPEYSIDRINNNLGYFKENCRWTTRAVQSRNKTTNIFVTYRGVTLCVTDMESKYGFKKGRLRVKMLKGLDVDTAMQQLLNSRISYSPAFF